MLFFSCVFFQVPDKEFLPLNRLKQNRYLKKKLEAVIDFMKLSI